MASSQAQLTGHSNEGIANLEAEERWKAALESYREETGHDLLEYTFARDILSQSRADEVMAQFTKFKEFRSSGGKILRVLKPIVSVVLRFIDAGAEAGSVCISLSFFSEHYLIVQQKILPGGKAIFVAVGALLQASRRSSSSLASRSDSSEGDEGR